MIKEKRRKKNEVLTVSQSTHIHFIHSRLGCEDAGGLESSKAYNLHHLQKKKVEYANREVLHLLVSCSRVRALAVNMVVDKHVQAL